MHLSALQHLIQIIRNQWFIFHFQPTLVPITARSFGENKFQRAVQIEPKATDRETVTMK